MVTSLWGAPRESQSPPGQQKWGIGKCAWLFKDCTVWQAGVATMLPWGYMCPLCMTPAGAAMLSRVLTHPWAWAVLPLTASRDRDAGIEMHSMARSTQFFPLAAESENTQYHFRQLSLFNNWKPTNYWHSNCKEGPDHILHFPEMKTWVKWVIDVFFHFSARSPPFLLHSYQQPENVLKTGWKDKTREIVCYFQWSFWSSWSFELIYCSLSDSESHFSKISTVMNFPKTEAASCFPPSHTWPVSCLSICSRCKYNLLAQEAFCTWQHSESSLATMWRNKPFYWYTRMPQ